MARIREGHSAVRRANRIETAEDYVEAIDDLVREHGEARVKDLALCFGVSHVTVSRTVDRLQREGLVVTAPYRAIELSDEGRELAGRSRARHASVLRFLLAIGIPPTVATRDAEGLEHHVSDDTLAAFERFVESRPEERERLERDLLTGESARSTGPERFARVRSAHAAELTEDYVEAIGDLIEDRGEARVVHLSRRFGVSHVTVSRMVGRLKRDGYVDTEPYRPITLTEAGVELASASKERHRVVLTFLLALGIPRESAEIDAEGVEHHVSSETLRVFAAFSE
ncbi:MAG: manganese-binding transcriptional regulator MntR [Planctomycetota bacterium]